MRTIVINARALNDALNGTLYLPSDELLASVREGSVVKVRVLEVDEDGGANPWSAKSVWIEVGEVHDGTVIGGVWNSSLDAAGFRQGDGIQVAVDKIFDVNIRGENGRLLFNMERAERLQGKLVLVGLSIFDRDDELVEQTQFAGRIQTIQVNAGFEIVRSDGSSYWLPPEPRSFEEAAPGEYRLRSTGEVIVNPDFVSTWCITQGAHGFGPSHSGFHHPN